MPQQSDSVLSLELLHLPTILQSKFYHKRIRHNGLLVLSQLFDKHFGDFRIFELEECVPC
jgi:hypothetical protein